jgi:hypothetical protein
MALGGKHTAPHLARVSTGAQGLGQALSAVSSALVFVRRGAGKVVVSARTKRQGRRRREERLEKSGTLQVLSAATLAPALPKLFHAPAVPGGPYHN